MRKVLIYGEDQQGALEIYKTLLERTNRLDLLLMSSPDMETHAARFCEETYFCICVTMRHENLKVDPPQMMEINLYEQDHDFDAVADEILKIVDYENWTQHGSSNLIVVCEYDEVCDPLRSRLEEMGWNVLRQHTTRPVDNIDGCAGVEFFFRSKEDFDADEDMKALYKGRDGNEYGVVPCHVNTPFVGCLPADTALEVMMIFEDTVLMYLEHSDETSITEEECDKNGMRYIRMKFNMDYEDFDEELQIALEQLVPLLG
jgi:hypothetical protein